MATIKGNKPAAKPEVEETVSTAIAVQEKAELSTDVLELSDEDLQYVNDFQQSDFSMPFLQILQSNSPQVEEGGPKYIDGAKPGMMLVTGLNEVIDTQKGSLKFVPVHYRKTFVEWIPRDNGGGFVKDHGSDAAASRLYASAVKDDKGRMIISSGNQLVETAQYVVLFEYETDKYIPAVMTFTSTQLKKSRTLNMQIETLRIAHKGQQVKPPMYYSVFSEGPTVIEKNDKGSWRGHKIDRFGNVADLPGGKDIFLIARELRASIEKGEVDMSKAAEAEAAASGQPTDAPAASGQSYDASNGAF